jgi:glycosyltransferase involved in cell wall biosynthesis
VTTLLQALSISVIVPTFGDDERYDLFADVALRSVGMQSAQPHELFHARGATLAEARNGGARQATGEWLLFLDADDALEQGYIDAMQAMIATTLTRSDARWFLLQPATRGWYPDGTLDDEMVMIPPKPSLRDGNHLVVSTLIPRQLFFDAGGFWDEPQAEDWSLFLRLSALGAVPVPVPDAVLNVYQNPESRNRTPIGGLYRRILDAHDKWRATKGLA